METTIIEALQKEGWNFDKGENGIYHTIYNGVHGKFSVHLNLNNVNSSLLFATSYFLKTVANNSISAAAWQLNAINLKISIGSFQINTKSGEISYQVGIYFFNTPFQMDMVRNILNAVVSYTNQHYLLVNGLLNNDRIN